MGELDPTLAVALGAAVGYLVGSVPWGLVLVRMAGLGDIREIGSGNIGATNVLRTGNKPLAFLTLVLDIGKGAFAAWAFLQVSDPAGYAAGFCAVLGHNFPVWLKFKGGKGVATTLGVVLTVNFTVGALTCAAWLLIAGTFRYSSLASMGSLVASPVFAYWFTGDMHLVTMTAGLAVLSLIRHRANIGRLMRREESKIGQKKQDKAAEAAASDTK